MRFPALIVLGFLVGCVGAPETAPSADPEVQPGPGLYVDPTPTLGPPGCGAARQPVMGPGGSVIWVPIPCNPFYMDMGDPPPDDVLPVEEVDPGPDGIEAPVEQEQPFAR